MSDISSRLEENANRLQANLENWETGVLRRIGQRIKKVGKMTPAEVKQLNNIVDVKRDLDAVTKELARVTGLNIRQVMQMYDEALTAHHIANKPLYDYRGKLFTDFAENTAAQSIAYAYAKTTAQSMINLSKTKALGITNASGRFIGLDKAYTDALDKAVMQVASGATDFNTAMRDTIKSIGGSGIRVNYGGGITRQIDTAVRQSVLWGAKQASVAYNEMIGEELRCDGIEIDWHSNPRPSHEFMQGKQYSLNGKKTVNGKTYEDATPALRALEDYGCLHFKTPIICGVSEPAFTEKELAELNRKNARTFTIDGRTQNGYEWKQDMRRLEAETRKQRNIRTIAEASGDKELVRQCDDRIKLINKKYAQISKATGIKTDTQRMGITRGAVPTNNSMEQHFKGVVKDKSQGIDITWRKASIHAEKLTNTNNGVYVTDKVKLKPKQQRMIDKNITEALECMDIQGDSLLPRFVIVDSSEISNGAIAAYSATENVLKIVSDLGITSKIPILQADGVLPDNPLSTYIHELFHWQDAQEYIKVFGSISKYNYGDYIEFINQKAKKYVDKLIRNGYNIEGISTYAESNFDFGHMDEVYTEYRTLMKLGGALK